MPLDWRQEQAIERIRQAAAGVLLDFAHKLRREHQRDLAGSYPPASRPGEFPHRRTGRLQDAVAVVPDSVRAVASRGSVAIGYRRSVDYAEVLVERGRRWLADTLARYRSVWQPRSRH